MTQHDANNIAVSLAIFKEIFIPHACAEVQFDALVSLIRIVIADLEWQNGKVFNVVEFDAIIYGREETDA